mgnify:CR=1 FL=1
MTDLVGVTQADETAFHEAVEVLNTGAIRNLKHGLEVVLQRRIASTEALQAEIAKLREALEAWEKWEGKWLLDDRAWVRGDPIVPCDLHDEYVAGPQSLRVIAFRTILENTDTRESRDEG